MVLRQKHCFILMMAAICCATALFGCMQTGSVSDDKSKPDIEPQSVADLYQDEDKSATSMSSSESSGSSYTDGWGLVTDDLIEEFVERYNELESYAIEELNDREHAVPLHLSIGQEAKATDNLAVSVLSVEPGPYDHEDNTPTTKVTVSMRNLSEKTVFVKASNWDADNDNGQRVDHKLYVKDESGNKDVRSFEPTKVSPNATFKGVIYFDGEGLYSVIYEPHWLVSSQNQYIYFDL